MLYGSTFILENLDNYNLKQSEKRISTDIWGCVFKKKNYLI